MVLQGANGNGMEGVVLGWKESGRRLKFKKAKRVGGEGGHCKIRCKIRCLFLDCIQSLRIVIVGFASPEKFW